MAGIEGIFDGRSMAGLQEKGSIRRGDGFATIRFGHSAFGAVAHVGGVYQKRRANKRGRDGTKYKPGDSFYVKMRYYRPTNPNTPAQQAGRTKFAEAIAGWQALSPVDKQNYNSKAKRHSRNGYSLYISEYMRYN